MGYKKRPFTQWFEDRGEDVAAAVSGAANLPMDVARYGTHAYTFGKDMFTMQSDKEIQDAYNKANAFWDNPPFFSEQMNIGRRQLAENNPYMTFLGEIAAGGGLAAGTVKRVVNLAKDGKGGSKFLNRFTGNTMGHSRKEVSAIGATAAGIGELVNEPIVDTYVDQMEREKYAMAIKNMMQQYTHYGENPK